MSQIRCPRTFRSTLLVDLQQLDREVDIGEVPEAGDGRCQQQRRPPVAQFGRRSDDRVGAQRRQQRPGDQQAVAQREFEGRLPAGPEPDQRNGQADHDGRAKCLEAKARPAQPGHLLVQQVALPDDQKRWEEQIHGQRPLDQHADAQADAPDQRPGAIGETICAQQRQQIEGHDHGKQNLDIVETRHGRHHGQESDQGGCDKTDSGAGDSFAQEIGGQDHQWQERNVEHLRAVHVDAE